MYSLRDLLLLTVLSLVILGNLYDFATDFAQGAAALHLLAEAGMILGSGLLIVWLLTDRVRQRRELDTLRSEIANAVTATPPLPPQAAATRRQLSAQIRSQFHDWALTDSEQEVGLLLLKGLSCREIAVLRATREKTVRAQASAIYRKAGVNGRHAFAAWFIEDFL